MKGDSLGDRMKGYEKVTRTSLIRKTPVIIRIDGKAFHTFTKRFDRPFSNVMNDLMVNTTSYLCRNIQNAVMGYTQSDEISILLNDWSELETQQWFGGGLQKIVSVSASMATGAFNTHYRSLFPDNKGEVDIALFDSRAFNVPKEEVVNYFVWRQQDASRNSVQMLGRAYFSHKELHQKNNSDIQDMLMLQHNVNWNDIDTWKKRGTCVVKTDGIWKPDYEIPIFTKDREYIENLL